MPQLNQRGQGLVEYLVIVALMAVATMAIMRTLNHNVSAQFARIAVVLNGGEGESVKTESVRKTDYDKRDMSDFFHGARGRDDSGKGSGDTGF